MRTGPTGRGAPLQGGLASRMRLSGPCSEGLKLEKSAVGISWSMAIESRLGDISCMS